MIAGALNMTSLVKLGSLTALLILWGCSPDPQLPSKVGGGAGGATASGGGTGVGGGTQATGGAGGGSGLAVDGYRAGITTSVCVLWVRCGRMSSQQGCLDAQVYSGAVTSAFWASLDVSLSARRSAFDPLQAQACLDFIRNTQRCDQSDQGPCDLAFRPTVADGAPCFLEGECAAASYCTAQDPTCPGSCQPRKALGTSATSQLECVRGATLYEGRCAALVPIGNSCAPASGTTAKKSCVAGAYCAASDVCQAQAVVGGACPIPQACAYPASCVMGVCRAMLGPGQVCRYNVGESCQGDLHCERQRTDISGTCTAYLNSGAACLESNSCKPPLVCTGGDQFAPNGGRQGQCTAPLALGAPCNAYTYGECGAGWCRPSASGSSSGSCSARLAFGAACTGFEAGCPQGGYCLAGVCRRYYCTP